MEHHLIRLQDLRLTLKQGFAFGLVILAIILSNLFTFVNFSRTRAIAALDTHTYVVLQAATEAKLATAEQLSAAKSFAVTGDRTFEVRYRETADLLAKKISELQALTVDNPVQQARLVKVAQAVTLFDNEVGDPVMKLGADPGGRSAAQTLIFSSKTHTTAATVRDLLTAVQGMERELLTARDAGLKRAEQGVDLSLVGAGVVATLLAIASGSLLARTVVAPMVGLTTVMGRIARDEFTVEVPWRNRADEIGQMAKAVQAAKESGLARLALEAEAKAFQDKLDRRLKEMEANFQAAGRDQSQVVESLADGLRRLAAGELRHRLADPFASDYERLRADFNATLAKLQETMGVIQDGAGGFTAGAGEISQAADDLSRRTEQQAASLEQTAAALDEITAAVQRTAEGAKAARAVVVTAKSDAEDSGHVVGEAVQAMGRIEESSRQISQIIGVIDEIAFQTNLLALNAGVEAARAGDAGRGFAVVAQEVRGLAQRSAEAAKEIKALISSSGQEVQIGVELVNKTGQALERIIGHVNQATALVGEIAASAQEQATGLNQVNAAVNLMDQSTQQNAGMVQQSTSASRGLASEAEALTRLVGQFDIGPRAAVAQARAQPGRRSSPPPSPSRAAVRTSGRGGAAPKLVAQPDDEGWESF